MSFNQRIDSPVLNQPTTVAGSKMMEEAKIGGTTPDMLFTLQTVNCVGACALAPAVRVGEEETHGRMTPASARKLVKKLRRTAEA